MNPDIYILGTGLSHNGSAVLLKNGRVCVAIEKERLSRIKHDGGNDTLAIQYCLDAEGIELEDVSLVVQCANFEIPQRDQFQGKRIFAGKNKPELVDISHHLAHAYSAVGTSPFSECTVIVIDGCGSPLNQYLALHPNQSDSISKEILGEGEMQCEKDSFYYFDGNKIKPLWKDFSKMSVATGNVLDLPTTQHSIGGFYSAVSHYVFGDMNDMGKLMGLAPYGNPGVYKIDAFKFSESSSLLVSNEWQHHFTNPSSGLDHLKENFHYYADIACWAQEQVEKAVVKCIQLRVAEFPHRNLCYSGGVALNAAANAKLLEKNIAENIYFEPAAADNGLALGCAFYGWIEYMEKSKVEHNGTICFGKEYDQNEISDAVRKDVNNNYDQQLFPDENTMLRFVAGQLNEGKTVGWFHSGSEFGPRSLGRRSILAHPGKATLKHHINKNIKFREDFRPFAPSVLRDHVKEYFVSGRSSPYMILLDETRSKYLDQLRNVTHCNGTARVQTVDETWNARFAKLLTEFYYQSGIPVLLNTSLNKKGAPMVETPSDAISLFNETALDYLVLENMVLTKKSNASEMQKLDYIIDFLTKIGMKIIDEPLNEPCVLPGLKIQEDSIRLDRKRLKHVGDILHEAGHLAVTPKDQRILIGTEHMDPSWPGHGDEIAAILWSYAASCHLNLSLDIVFHPDGYKNESDWIIKQFNNQNYIGLPLLEWMSLCTKEEFPIMRKWIR